MDAGSGSDARLCKQAYRPALLSIFLSNTRSITYKMDELEPKMGTKSFVQKCSVILIMERLHLLIPDSAVQLH